VIITVGLGTGANHHLFPPAGDQALGLATFGRHRIMGDVARVEHLGPGGEFQAHSVGIEEVDRAHEHLVGHFGAHLARRIVVVEDRRDGDALGLQARIVFVELLRRHVEGDVVHRAVGADDRALAGQARRAGNARLRFRSAGKPEEGEAVAVADVEEEMLSEAAGKVDRLGQRHAEHIAIEPHRARHVFAHQRQMVDAPDLELHVRRLRHR